MTQEDKDQDMLILDNYQQQHNSNNSNSTTTIIIDRSSLNNNNNNNDSIEEGANNNNKERKISQWNTPENLSDVLLLCMIGIWTAITVLRYKNRDNAQPSDVPLGLLIAASSVSGFVLLVHVLDIYAAFRDAFWRGFCGFGGGKRFKTLQYKPGIWWWAPLQRWIFAICVCGACWCARLPGGYPWIGFGCVIVVGLLGEPGIVKWACAFEAIPNRPSHVMLGPGNIHKKTSKESIKMRTSKIALVYFEDSMHASPDHPMRHCNAIWDTVQTMGCRAWTPMLIPRTALEANQFRTWINWRANPGCVAAILVGPTVDSLYKESALDWTGAHHLTLFGYGSFFRKFTCLVRENGNNWTSTLILDVKKAKPKNKEEVVEVVECPLTQGYCVWAARDLSMCDRLLTLQSTCENGQESFPVDGHLVEEACHFAAINSDLSYLLVIGSSSADGVRNGSTLRLMKEPLNASIVRTLWDFRPSSKCWSNDRTKPSCVVLDRQLSAPPVFTHRSIIVDLQGNSNVGSASSSSMPSSDIKWFSTTMHYKGEDGQAMRLHLGLQPQSTHTKGQKLYKVRSICYTEAHPAFYKMSLIPKANEVLIL
ncbi:hypothetical protein SAMD00019534_086260 [Acytostelium subglobosum LB1]|uniref:hypothetical protein n=1 Tax=Acytostelium subglobosum LB1 TaxID=1410327 RepID=UPI000644ECB7|nr:hypothetical protein SAMD00019534_086260 [Acytostelium subglobosum LB1]GAM25451.1 hypothetical protein SAMD00019534_086260 [Acytostelium subglobosum LB1]|eukprot:XP_012751437.1 hypothetical protein SAMD00019534_086260 [Acytostelium subglobosum LB1]